MHRRLARESATTPALAHLSAALVYGMWLPTMPSWLPRLLVQSPGTQRPERFGCYVFRSRAGLEEACVVAAECVVSPQVCLAQLAEDLSVLDLTIAIDSALHQKLCTMDDITTAARPRQRGLPRLHRALELCDGRSESPWETVLRVLLSSSGVSVTPQAKIEDDAGHEIGWADLRIDGTRRLAEYDGEVHRERERHQLDLSREKALARADWERYGYTAKEILQNPLQVLRDAEQALGWSPDPNRLATWRVLVDESSFAPYGRSLLAKRLQRFNRPLRGRKPRT
jgi:very-short-patch-repair endonuclease